jgi:tetratricopeptide (TPR) repeat protein
MIKIFTIAIALALAHAVLYAQQAPDQGSMQIVAQSQEALSRDDPGKALALVQEGLYRLPDDEALRVQMARIYAYQRQDRQAIDLLNTLLLKNPNGRNPKLELAAIFGYRANYVQSDRLYRELLAADANDEAASLGLIHNLILEGKKADARRELARAAALHPTSLELQQYKDYLAANAGEEVTRRTTNRIQTTESFFADTSANRSAYSAQTLTDQLSRNSSSRFVAEETSLWKSGGPSTSVIDATEELRYRINKFVGARAGGGAVRFADGNSRLLYSGDFDFYPWKNLTLSAGFSRFPIAPTFDAAQFDLLSEGWHGRAGYNTRNFSVNGSLLFTHYSDGNHSEREWAEALRWFGLHDSRFAVAGGYAFRHLHFPADLNHGYFSPSQYFSHLAAVGFRMRIGKRYSGEYLGYGGGERLNSLGGYSPAGELLVKNDFSFGRWQLAADYSYFHLIQTTGAFRANALTATLGYKF